MFTLGSTSSFVKPVIVVQVCDAIPLWELVCVPNQAGWVEDIPVKAEPSIAGKVPVKFAAGKEVKLAPDPEKVVAVHVPVTLTPVAVVVNLADAECFKETEESDASDIASSVLCLDCISSTFSVDIILTTLN